MFYKARVNLRKLRVMQRFLISLLIWAIVIVTVFPHIINNKVSHIYILYSSPAKKGDEREAVIASEPANQENNQNKDVLELNNRVPEKERFKGEKSKSSTPSTISSNSCVNEDILESPTICLDSYADVHRTCFKGKKY
jgi:hypothetical protein